MEQASSSPPSDRNARRFVGGLTSAMAGMSVRAKLLASFGLLLVLMIGLAGTGVVVASAAGSNARSFRAEVDATRDLKQLQLDGASVAVSENSVAFDSPRMAAP